MRGLKFKRSLQITNKCSISTIHRIFFYFPCFVDVCTLVLYGSESYRRDTSNTVNSNALHRPLIANNTNANKVEVIKESPTDSRNRTTSALPNIAASCKHVPRSVSALISTPARSNILMTARCNNTQFYGGNKPQKLK